jgi:hypothetical protein
MFRGNRKKYKYKNCQSNKFALIPLCAFCGVLLDNFNIICIRNLSTENLSCHSSSVFRALPRNLKVADSIRVFLVCYLRVQLPTNRIPDKFNQIFYIQIWQFFILPDLLQPAPI